MMSREWSDHKKVPEGDPNPREPGSSEVVFWCNLGRMSQNHKKVPEQGSILEPPTPRLRRARGNQDFLRAFLVHCSRI